MLNDKILVRFFGVLFGFGLVGIFIFWWNFFRLIGRKDNGVFIEYFELLFLFLLFLFSVFYFFLGFIFVIKDM